MPYPAIGAGTDGRAVAASAWPDAPGKAVRHLHATPRPHSSKVAMARRGECLFAQGRRRPVRNQPERALIIRCTPSPGSFPVSISTHNRIAQARLTGDPAEQSLDRRRRSGRLDSDLLLAAGLQQEKPLGLREAPRTQGTEVDTASNLSSCFPFVMIDACVLPAVNESRYFTACDVVDPQGRP